MSGDFVALNQGQLSITTGSSSSLAIPTSNNLPGLPAGAPIVIRVTAKTDAIYKLGVSGDSASKTIGSDNFYSNGNIYAEKNAIETFKIISASATVTPTHFHVIADTVDGIIRVAFGYYM